MSKELEELQYMDLLSDISSAIEHFGARKVLLDFKQAFPNHYNEMFVQMTRSIGVKQIPVLLIKKENNV